MLKARSGPFVSLFYSSFFNVDVMAGTTEATQDPEMTLRMETTC